MRESFIFQIGMKALTPLLLVGSLIIFWRGHQLPGGGFIGGLVAGATFAAHAFCYSTKSTLELIRLHPVSIMLLGLSCSLLSAYIGFFAGAAPLKGLWIEIPLIGGLGTPVLFDLGVYLLVAGFVITFITEALKSEAE